MRSPTNSRHSASSDLLGIFAFIFFKAQPLKLKMQWMLWTNCVRNDSLGLATENFHGHHVEAPTVMRTNLAGLVIKAIGQRLSTHLLATKRSDLLLPVVFPLTLQCTQDCNGITTRKAVVSRLFGHGSFESTHAGRCYSNST